jgi:hypothetical protein
MDFEISQRVLLKRFPVWRAAVWGGVLGGVVSLSGVRAGDVDFEMQVYDQPYSKSLTRADKTRLTVQVDPNNRRVDEVLYSPNQTVLWRLIRELDAAYQPVRGTKFDAFDQIVSRHKYFWLKGRLEEEEIYSARNVLLARMRYYYDAKGRPEKIEHYNASDALISVTRSSGGDVEPIRREVKGGAQPARKSR